MFEEERIGEFVKQIESLITEKKSKIEGFLMAKSSGETRPLPEHNDDISWESAEHGVKWGGNNEYYSFKGSITIPGDMEGKRVKFVLLTGREGEWDATNPQFTLFVNGILKQGFDVNHNFSILTENGATEESYDIFLSSFTGIQNYSLSFCPFIMTEDVKVRELYYDIKTLYDTARILEKTDDNYRHLISDLTNAVNMLDLRNPYSDNFYNGINLAHEYLSEKYYKNKKSGLPKVFCVGHTHIDIAWLWTLKVTRDKAVRSFSTALELMDRYPAYTFMSSQPQLYKYVKEDAPEVYEKIKKRIAEGRWEAEGGMFLEPDCNLTGGESLVRQFIYGKRFFKQEFNVDSEILWLPDVFGYSAALPQIMKKCGIKYFMTTKISWNEVNMVPYDTFYWKGIDGSKILSYFITTRDYVSKSRDTKTSNEFCTEISTNYNGYINPSEMMGAWQRYQQKDLSEDILCSYGYGDGGGGPTEEMIETEKRMEYGVPGCPYTVNSKAGDFFNKLDENVSGKNVPVWSGELYLEYHRGTYTSMAENKRNNRKAEYALLKMETLGKIAEEFGYVFPKEGCDELWEKVMRNQFHDILPGSAVKEVYDDSRMEYAEVFSKCNEITKAAESVISDNIAGAAVFNPSGIRLSGIAVSDSINAIKYMDQISYDGKFIIYAEDVNPKGFLKLGKGKHVFKKVSVCEEKIETPFAEIEFNYMGQITSWFDKENNRQILKPGSKANVLRAFDDRPHKYDNWNIFDYYKETYWDIEDLVSKEVIENGPARYGIRFTWNYMSSTVSEVIYVYPFTSRVDFCFTANWNENQTLLKTVFPIDINTDEATYDIQYGNVTRKTHRNTSWDAARFETCMHKWADISEGDFGVSFLNDCKYGISVEENEVGISLLKCGNYPNPKADRGYHEAVYSVYPHTGTWKEAGTVKQAYELNNPLSVIIGKSEKNNIKENPVILCENENIVTEVIKPSEKGKETVIRSYEYMNRRTRASFILGKPAKEIWVCDMLENEESLVATDTDRFTADILPFEILTIKIK